MKKVHGDRLILELIKESSSSILIVSTDDDHVVKAIILDLGESIDEFRKGDVILFEKPMAIPFRYEGKDLFILRAGDVIATI